MATRKAAQPAASGMVKAQYVLEFRHVQALRAEAFKRAGERGEGKPDASEVLREILDAWTKRRPK